MPRRDLHWLAGLMEGEGSFFLSRKGYPYMSIGMNDEDVIVDVAQMTHSNVSYTRNKSGTMRYMIQIGGQRALDWMLKLFPYMGDRRQAKIMEVSLAAIRIPVRKRAHGYRSEEG